MRAPSDNAYDQLPYRSTPFAHTQPSHLAAIATLFGMSPPRAESARVLELGCAAGGNIIPLAARFPEAHFTGVDLSARHVEDAQRAISELGLANIEIAQGNVAEIAVAGRQFDYVVCHGVYSWVPRVVQEAILRICAQSLVPNGVAYISYNVLPGWHLRKIVRDVCAYHAGKEGSPQKRVARARWILEQVARQSSETTNFGRILRDEAKLTAPLPDSYILGEFLADENEPCYFHDFVDRAAGHGLAFLCETDLAASVPENYGAEPARLVRAIAGTSGAAVEQYIDFFSGRPFRRSLLIKEELATTIERTLTPQRLRSLHFVTRMRADPAASMAGESVFTNGAQTLTTNDPVLRRAIGALVAASPGTCSLEELIGVSREEGTPDPAPGEPSPEARLLNGLFKAVSAGQIAPSSLPLRVGRAGARRSVVFNVARSQAAIGQDWASSLGHRAVALHPAMRLLMPLIDGTRDKAALCDRLSEALRSRQVTIDGLGDDALADPDRLGSAAAAMIDHLLHYLEQNALLDAG